MRLNCEVDVVRQLPTDCSAMRKTGRASKAILTVGKEGGSQSKSPKISLVISTSNNRNGPKYMLSGNITRLHARFAEEGKGTIILTNPPVEIFISKADPIQLKSILRVLHLVERGKDVGMHLSIGSAEPPSASGMKALQTSMEIKSRREYPLTCCFPRGLKKLTVNGCAMKRLDPRILDLRHLQTLNLTNNLLTTLPDNPGRWTSLTELDLSSNKLSEVPSVLYSSYLKDMLLTLKLNNNNLTRLPLQLCLIGNLVNLQVNDNQLSALPPNIGALSKLFTLSAQRNLITRLPGGMTQLKLEVLDLFGNPIEHLTDNLLISSNLGIPSLRELASRFIRAERLEFGEEDVPRDLIYYLNNARRCWCGYYCFESCARVLRKCELSQLSTVVQAWDERGSKDVPVEVFLCSTACLEKFQNNPFAYWR